MAFVTGLLLIDAPASALNNLGTIPGEREDNTVGVKAISTREGKYPYVSAQAWRYWLRTTLQAHVPAWKPAPTFREEKIAYTDANPLHYWDDDLFGYMRAPSKRESAKAQRQANQMFAEATEITDTITRAAPLRVSTLVSLAPVTLTTDFGTMSRHEGNPVPHEHQFYRATLKGLFSLNLTACGTFSYVDRTGFRNLDEIRKRLAEDTPGIEHLEAQKAYRLPYAERVARIKALFEGMALLEGGAKQTLHYTDVSAPLVLLAVTRGGNHIFNHVVGTNAKGQPVVKLDAFAEAVTVNQDLLLSPVYIGWTKGYLDEQRAEFAAFLEQHAATLPSLVVDHPRTVFAALIADFDKHGHAEWLA